MMRLIKLILIILSIFFVFPVYSFSQSLDRYKDLDEETLTKIARLKNPFLPKLPSTDMEKTTGQDDSLQVIDTSDTYIGSTVEPDPEIQPPNFIVSGLIWNTDRPQAIVDKKVVEIGDQVEIWTIKKINHEGVALSFQNQIFILSP